MSLRSLFDVVLPAFALAVCAYSHAEEFPAKRVTFVVPHPAGTAPDNLIRPISQVLSKQFGQPFVVENKTGASGQIGMSYVARSQPDGYTLIVYSNATMVANPVMFKKLSYDASKDFVPVALLGRTSMMYVVRAESTIRSIEGIAAARASEGRPLTIGYGSSTAQVAAQILATATGEKMTFVPYQGTPGLVNDVLGGTVDLAVVDIGTGVVQTRGGRMRSLATAASGRLNVAGAVPALIEKYKEAPSLDSWIAIGAPAGTPPDTVEKLNAAINAAMKTAEVANAFNSAALDLATATPHELGQIIKADQEKWPPLIRAAGIEAQ